MYLACMARSVRPRTQVATRWWLSVIAATAVIVSMSAGVASGAGGGSARRDSMVAVPQGSGPALLASGTALGPTAAATPIQVSFILRARGLANLESRTAAGWTGAFLTRSQFASQFGQTPAFITSYENYLHRFGITTSSFSDRLDIAATGTAAQFDRALQISLRNFRVRSSSPTRTGHTHLRTVHGSLISPQLPKQFADRTLAVLGLSNNQPFSSAAVRALGRRVVSTKAAAAALPPGMLSPRDFVTRYHLASLEAGGAKGQGQVIGIVTLAAIHTSAPMTFWNHYLGLGEPAGRLKLIPIDGGAPGPSAAVGSDETDLDVEQSGAIAPKANVRVYEAPNSDPGFADGFYAAASDNIASTVSTSWGESETFLQESIANGTESPAVAAALDQVFAELGAQGQSSFAATGDFGAYDAVPDAGTTNLAADNPSDSPYTTAAGGTTIPGPQTYAVTNANGVATGAHDSVTIPAERAWGWDYLWPLHAAFGVPNEKTFIASAIGGGDGGYSVLEPRPAYQTAVSLFSDRRYLTPTDFTTPAPGLSLPRNFSFNPAPILRSNSHKVGRAVPDVSTNADPQTGYAVYDGKLLGGFIQEGGTSFVAPQLNGATAVINSSLHHRVGFWNPRIYAFASAANSPFTPLNNNTAFSGVRFLRHRSKAGVITALPGQFSNDNLFYTGRKDTIWNPASGLGVPNLGALAAAFKP
jgi:kumamolisin